MGFEYHGYKGYRTMGNLKEAPNYIYMGGILFHNDATDGMMTIEGVSEDRLRKILCIEFVDILIEDEASVFFDLGEGKIYSIYTYESIANELKRFGDDFESLMWMQFLKAVLSYVNHFGSWQDVAKYFSYRRDMFCDLDW